MTPEVRKLFDQMKEARLAKNYVEMYRALDEIKSNIGSDSSQAAYKLHAAARHELMLSAWQQYNDTKELRYLTMAQLFAKSAADFAKKARDPSWELLAQVSLGGRILPALNHRDEGKLLVDQVLERAQRARPDSSEEQDRLLEVIRLARDFIAQNQSSP